MTRTCEEHWPNNLTGLTDDEFDGFLDHAHGCSVHKRQLLDFESRIESLVGLAIRYDGLSRSVVVTDWADSEATEERHQPVGRSAGGPCIDLVWGGTAATRIQSTLTDIWRSVLYQWGRQAIRAAVDAPAVLLLLIFLIVFWTARISNVQRSATTGDVPSSLQSGTISSDDVVQLEISAQKVMRKFGNKPPSWIFNQKVASMPKVTAAQQSSGKPMKSFSNGLSSEILRVEVKIIDPCDDGSAAKLTVRRGDSIAHLCSSTKDKACVFDLEPATNYELQIQQNGYKTSEIDLSKIVDISEYVTLERTSQ